MRTIGHPLFIAFFLLYVVYYLLKHAGVVLPSFITSYLADLLSLFIINTIALFFLRKWYGIPDYELHNGMVLLSFIIITLVFEVIQPAVGDYAVFDPYDILCYAVSATGYLLWRKPF
ncbi:MAG: hypothetical protein ACQERC_01810 [Bacteroidota bacterium]